MRINLNFFAGGGGPSRYYEQNNPNFTRYNQVMQPLLPTVKTVPADYYKKGENMTIAPTIGSLISGSGGGLGTAPNKTPILASDPNLNREDTQPGPSQQPVASTPASGSEPLSYFDWVSQKYGPNAMFIQTTYKDPETGKEYGTRQQYEYQKYLDSHQGSGEAPAEQPAQTPITPEQRAGAGKSGQWARPAKVGNDTPQLTIEPWNAGHGQIVSRGK